MGPFNGRGDWFSRQNWFSREKGPFGWDSGADEDEDELLPDYEFTLSFPQPPDKVRQSLRLVNGQLVVTFEFIFSEPELLETDDEEDD